MNRPYLLVYPERLTKPEASASEEDGDKFWQSFFSYFSGCDSDWDSEMRKAFRLRTSTNQATLVEQQQSDKIAEKPNIPTPNKIEPTPQKPFYFVLPPGNFAGAPNSLLGGAINLPGGPINPASFIKTKPEQSQSEKIDEKPNAQADNSIGSLPELFNPNQNDKIVENSNVPTGNKLESAPQKPFYFIIPPGNFAGGPNSFLEGPNSLPGGPIYRPIYIKAQPEQGQSEKIAEKPNVQTGDKVESAPQKPFFFPSNFPIGPINQQILFKPLPIYTMKHDQFANPLGSNK